jgi:hypothetical protein
MHRLGVGAFNEERCVAVSLKEILDLLVSDPSEKCWVVDLVTVEIEDREHRAVSNWIEKLINVP